MDRQSQTKDAKLGQPETGPVSSQPVNEATVIPVVAEEVVVGTKAVKGGAVRVHKHVQERVEHIEMPLTQDSIDIRRVVVNRVVDAPPRIRTEGDTIIVPVVEEEIVVTKRLVLKEELHLIRRRTQTRATREVTVRREEAEVERVDSQGRPANVEPAGEGPAPESILGGTTYLSRRSKSVLPRSRVRRPRES